MTIDATPAHKEEVHERQLRRVFHPAVWLVIVAFLMVAIVLGWLFVLR